MSTWTPPRVCVSTYMMCVGGPALVAAVAPTVAAVPAPAVSLSFRVSGVELFAQIGVVNSSNGKSSSHQNILQDRYQDMCKTSQYINVLDELGADFCNLQCQCSSQPDDEFPKTPCVLSS